MYASVLQSINIEARIGNPKMISHPLNPLHIPVHHYGMQLPELVRHWKEATVDQFVADTSHAPGAESWHKIFLRRLDFVQPLRYSVD